MRFHRPDLHMKPAASPVKASRQTAVAMSGSPSSKTPSAEASPDPGSAPDSFESMLAIHRAKVDASDQKTKAHLEKQRDALAPRGAVADFYKSRS